MRMKTVSCHTLLSTYMELCSCAIFICTAFPGLYCPDKISSLQELPHSPINSSMESINSLCSKILPFPRNSPLAVSTNPRLLAS